MYKYLQLEKIRRIEKSLLLLKIRRIWEIFVFTENQAVLRNPCVYRKSGGFEKSLRLQKNRRIWEILASTEKQVDDRILAGIEIPAPDKKPEFEEKPARLISSRSDPRRCDESRMQSPSEEKAQAPCFYGRTFPVLYRPAMPRNGTNPCGNQKSGVRLEFY